jgi:adenosine kinase
LHATKIIYSTGFFITSNNESLRKVCKLANERNKILAFNIAAVFLLMIAKDDVMFCIEHADLVFCNEDEASAYGKICGLDETDRVAIANHIANSKKTTSRPRVTVVTQGS